MSALDSFEVTNRKDLPATAEAPWGRVEITAVKKVCAMCTHSKAFTGDAKFTCLRYPPVPVWMSGESRRDSLVSRWPRVNGDDTCGEWKQ